MMIKLLSTTPLNLTLFPLFPQRLPPYPMALQSPAPHIHWKTAMFVPLPPSQKKITIGNKFTFHYHPAPDAFSNISSKASALSPGSKVSNSPYSLINSNFNTTSITTKKIEKPKITIDYKVTFHYPPCPDISPAAPSDASFQYPGSTVSNSPYSLINKNQYFKISPDTKKNEKQLTDAPDTDEPDAADNDAAYGAGVGVVAAHCGPRIITWWACRCASNKSSANYAVHFRNLTLQRCLSWKEGPTPVTCLW